METVPGSVSFAPNSAAAAAAAAAQAQADAAAAQRAMASRYGLAPGRYGAGAGGGRYGTGSQNLGGVQYVPLGEGRTAPPPQAYAPQPVASTGPKVLPIILDEKQLEVTMNLILVKMLPSK
jgi:hypothetical protein